MKIYNDDGALQVEDHEDHFVVRHKASNSVLMTEYYTTGNMQNWTLAFGLARGFQRGWNARDLPMVAVEWPLT